MASKRKRARALTVEGRENQLVDMAFEEAEKRILNGSASSQLICHFLKLGSTREGLERKKIEADLRLQDARVESLQRAETSEELYKNAIAAMRSYGGSVNFDDE